MHKRHSRYPQLAVLLAAGMGKRLRPFTAHTPKSLLRADGKPLLGHLFDALKLAGVQTVIMVTHHLEDQILRHAIDRYSDIFDLHFCHQPTLDGAAGALRYASKQIRTLGIDWFLVSATDYQLPPHYLAAFFRFHRDGDQDASVAVRMLPAHRIKACNLTIMDQDGRVESMIEKPAAELPQHHFPASYLLYVLPANSLGYLDGLPRSNRGEYEMSGMINRMIRHKAIVKGYRGEAFPEWEKQYTWR